MKSLIFPPNDGAIYYTAGRVGSYVEILAIIRKTGALVLLM